MRLSVPVSGTHRAAWCTNRKDSFPKSKGIPEHTEAIKRPVYVEPAVRDVDLQGPEGKPLPAEDEARERGRSQRVELQIPVLIYVQMPDGRSLRHNGFTLLVNTRGCVFTIETKLEVGQHIGPVNPKSGVEQPGTVTRVQKSRDGGYAVAFEFDSSTPRLWPLMFPPKNRKVERF